MAAKRKLDSDESKVKVKRSRKTFEDGLERFEERLFQVSSVKIAAITDAPNEAEVWTGAALLSNGAYSNNTGIEGGAAVSRRGGWEDMRPFIIVQPFICLFMFCSNLVVLYVYKRFIGFMTMTNYFIYNIATADLCMSFNMLVQLCFFIWPNLSSSEHLCMFRMELMAFFTTVALMSSFFATIDRFMMLVFNRYYHIVMSVRNVKLMIAFAWVYSFCFAALPFFHNNWDTVKRCVFVTVVPRWYLVFASSQTILTNVVQILIYLAIFEVARRRRKRFKPTVFTLSSSGPSTSTAGTSSTGTRVAISRAAKEQMKLGGARLMMVLLITYCLCWWPFAILGYLQVFMYHPFLTTLRMFMVYLGLSNSLVNPMIYAWQKKEFQGAIRRIQYRGRRRRIRVRPERSTRRTTMTLHP